MGSSLLFHNSEATVAVQLLGKTKPERGEGEEDRSWYSYLCFPVHWSKNMEGQVISPEEPLSHTLRDGDFLYLFQIHSKNQIVCVFLPLLMDTSFKLLSP